jgi:hypothetical protein
MHAHKHTPPPAHSFIGILEITSTEIFHVRSKAIVCHSAVYSAIALKNVDAVVREMQYYFIIPRLFLYPLYLDFIQTDAMICLLPGLRNVCCGISYVKNRFARTETSLQTPAG